MGGQADSDCTPVDEPARKPGRQKHDPVFDHFVIIKYDEKKCSYDARCSFCKSEIKGARPARFKHHLGCNKGRNVLICSAVPTAIKKQYMVASQQQTIGSLQRSFNVGAAITIDEAWADFFFENSIAFKVANSRSYKRLHDMYRKAVPSPTPPSAWSIAHPLLDKADAKLTNEVSILPHATQDADVYSSFRNVLIVQPQTHA
jgi:hypothetical protein